jgi:hypothetical protein
MEPAVLAIANSKAWEGASMGSQGQLSRWQCRDFDWTSVEVRKRIDIDSICRGQPGRYVCGKSETRRCVCSNIHCNIVVSSEFVVRLEWDSSEMKIEYWRVILILVYLQYPLPPTTITAMRFWILSLCQKLSLSLTFRRSQRESFLAFRAHHLSAPEISLPSVF